jgi:glycosyltransferase involved in cell wall biosynthesis
MRVLLTVPSLDRAFGDLTVKVHRLARELRALGHDVVIVGAGFAEAGVAGLPVMTHYHGTPIPSTIGPLVRLARGADVVHTLGYRDPIGTAACAIADRAGVPFVVEPAGMHRRRLRSARLKRAFDRVIGEALLDRAGAVVATSQLEADELLDDGVDPALIVVRSNGVDVDDLSTLPAHGTFRAQHGIPDDVPLVLSLCRIAGKGLVTFVEALARLPDAWGAVVGPDDGDGALRDLHRTVDQLRSERVVIVPEGLLGVEKASLFTDADAFCLPSASEDFGNAPAEAAALGVPVVVSKECGVAEFLDPAATAVVDHTDVSAVARGIEHVLDAGVRAAAAAAAPGLREALAWPSIASQQMEIYERVVAGRGPGLRPRVVLTVPSLRPSFGGPALQALPFAEAIRERGYDVRVLGCEAGDGSAIDLGRLGSFHGTPVPRRFAPIARSVRRADLVHVTGFRDPVGTLAAMRSRAPVVIEPMGMHRRRLRSVPIKTVFDRTVGAWVMRRCDLVVATSSLERDELVEDGVPVERIVVRPNGIDDGGDLARGGFRKDQRIPLDAPLVISLGRITTKKGLPRLVRAIAELPGCWLAIIGPDDGDGTLERVSEEIKRCRVADRVRLEPVGRWASERAGVYADANAFCLPSETENFGNAAAEAAASGLPVVISDRCGVAEFLPAASTAVVPLGDGDALREALAWALRPDTRAAAEGGSSSVRSRLSWSHVAGEQISIYERLLR